MDHWQPYLHTLLLTPSPYPIPEPFLLPTLLITSRSRFLLACLFTFTLALVERWLTCTLERLSSRKRRTQSPGTVGLKVAVFALVTATRYLLMIVVMGMDWVLLASVVAGMTGGFAVGECWKLRESRDAESSEEQEEVVQLLRCEMGRGGQDDG